MSCTKVLRHYASKELHSINLSNLLTRTKSITPETILSTALYHATDELPTRLAHRIDDLGKLPAELSSGNDSVDRVRKWYVQSFDELRAHSERLKDKHAENLNQTEWRELGAVLEGIDKRHQPVATTLAEGFHRHLQTHPELSHDNTLQQFLDVFHLSRIGMRTTSTQIVTLLNGLASGQKRPGFVGIVEMEMAVRDVIEKACSDASQVCVDYYGIYEAPKIVIDVPAALKTTYIPGYLWHICFELLKNSLRAIVETYEEHDYKPITISLSKESTDSNLIVQVTDFGGGIPQNGQDEVWKYMYTTADSPYSPDEISNSMASPSERAIMAGFGYGLPISRLYGRFCGGDLKLENHLGQGVDCFIHLPNKIHDY